MSITTIKTVIDDQLAKVHIGDGVEGKSSDTIVRKWVNIAPKNLHEAIDYLRRYTSAQNDATESMSVSDLIVDKTRLDGLWRGGKVSMRREDDGKYTIFQELHAGFVQTVNRTYIYQVTHNTESPDLSNLRFYDSGIDYEGNNVYYGENGVYARWTDPTLGDIITLKTNIGDGNNVLNYFSISAGTLTGNGDWSGTASIGSISISETNLEDFIMADGHLWETGAKQTVLRLPNVDPAKEEDIRYELQANETYTDFLTKYETISGTNYYIDSRPVPEEDGSLSILLFLIDNNGQEAKMRATVGDRISVTTLVLYDKTEKQVEGALESSILTTDGRVILI